MAAGTDRTAGVAGALLARRWSGRPVGLVGVPALDGGGVGGWGRTARAFGRRFEQSFHYFVYDCVYSKVFGIAFSCDSAEGRATWDGVFSRLRASDGGWRP